MSLIDNKITAFSKTVAALADKPSLGTTALLKQWFDSSPEELRVAHNNLIDFMAANYKFSSTDINVMDYNASGLATTFTGGIAAGTKALTLTTTPDFVAGQGINLQGALEASSLQVTAAATVSSNVTVTLNGVSFLVAVLSGDTAIQVATKIRVATYAGWTAGGTAGTDTVTFTSTTSGVKTDSAYSAGTTGATGTMTTTTQGTVDQISTVSSVSGLVVNIADNATRTITAGAILHDDSAAFTNALTQAKLLSAPLYFPEGTYYVNTSTITLQDVFIFGCGSKTVIKNIKVNTPLFLMQSAARVENLTIEAKSNNVVTPVFLFGVGATTVFFSDAKIENVNVQGNTFTTAVKFSLEAIGGWNVVIRDCVFYQVSIGIEIDSRANGYVTGSLFDNIKVDYYDNALKIYSSTNAFYQISQNNFKDWKVDDVFSTSVNSIAYSISGSANVYTNLVSFHDGVGSGYAIELVNYTATNKMTWGNCVSNTFLGGVVEGKLKDLSFLYQKNKFMGVTSITSGPTVCSLDNTKVSNIIPSNFIENFQENTANQLLFKDNTNLALVTDDTFDACGQFIHLNANTASPGYFFYHTDKLTAQSLYDQDYITVGFRYKKVAGTLAATASLVFNAITYNSSSASQESKNLDMGDGTIVTYFTFYLSPASKVGIATSTITFCRPDIFISAGFEFKLYDFYCIPNYVMDFTKVNNNRVAKIKYFRFSLSANKSFSYTDFNIVPSGFTQFESFTIGKMLIREVSVNVAYTLSYGSGGSGSVTLTFTAGNPGTPQLFDIACVVLN